MTDLDIFFDTLARAPQPSQRPLVILTWAQTLDGSVAWAQGARLAISGPAAMHFTHRLRAFCDGILVGIGAALADDPRLTARGVSGPQPQPLVLDTRLRLPATARILAHPRPPWILTGPHPDTERQTSLSARGAQILPQPLNEAGHIDLNAALRTLHQRGIRTLMVEGGPTVHSAFLRAGLADWLAITLSPQLLGGLPALRAVARPGAPIPRLTDWRTLPLTDDLLIWGTPSS